MRAQRFLFLTAVLYLCAFSAFAQREVAITFDDLPATRQGDFKKMKFITDQILRSLANAKAPATGFVNEIKLQPDAQYDKRLGLLRQWLDAGHDLGNHTYSHVMIDEVPFEEYKADLIRGEEATRALLEERGRKLRYFRHTQLRTGPSIEYKRQLDALLKERGYTIAPVTLDNDEYIFAYVYDRAKRSGDRKMMKRVADSYLQYMEGIFAHFEKLSNDFLGYEIKQVLLLHANELNAEYLDELLAMMSRRGYKFITLDEALADYAYRMPDAQVNRGLSWIHRWMIAKGLPVRLEPSAPAFVKEAALGQ